MNIAHVTFLTASFMACGMLFGVLVYVLSVSSGRAANRYFVALIVITMLLILQCIALYWHFFLGLRLPESVVSWLAKLASIGLIATGYLLFQFSELHFGAKPWTKRLRVALLTIGLVWAVFILVRVPTPDTYLRITPIRLPLTLYLAVCTIGVGTLAWQAPKRSEERLFIAGMIGAGLAFTASTFSTTDNFAPAFVLGVLSMGLIAVSLSQIQVLYPIERERRQLSEDNDRLLMLNEALNHVLEEPDLRHRLRLAAHALSQLGWQEVRITLREPSIVVTEPPTLITKPLTEEAWETLPSKLETAKRIGTVNFVPAGDPTLEAWQPEDRGYIPLRLEGGQLAGLITLTEPVSGKRPTNEEGSMRGLGILASQIRATIETSALMEKQQATAEALQDQVDELQMMQRVDKELSATLNFENVMMLTLDWALRRTGAVAGVLCMMSRDRTGLVPFAILGYPPAGYGNFNEQNPLPLDKGIIGRTARTRQIQNVTDVALDADYLAVMPNIKSSLAVPLEISGKVIGVLNLDSNRNDFFDENDVQFVERLARRAAVAMDNARLYREAYGRADEIAELYAAGRTISGSIEYADVLTNAAQSLAAVLNVSSAVLLNYQKDFELLTVSNVYQLGTARDAKPQNVALGQRFNIDEYPELTQVVAGQTPEIYHVDSPLLSKKMRHFLENLGALSVMVTPVYAQEIALGLALAIEGRRRREFSPDEAAMMGSLVSQIGIAIRQAELFEGVRELETIKSEMIRMASHDLRTPLGNTINYFELFAESLKEPLDERQLSFCEAIRRSTLSMKTLIEDLLTLETIESEQSNNWKTIDFELTVREMVDSLEPGAALKHQKVTLKIDPSVSRPYQVQGSLIQVRQAVTNLIGNAIKYTPDNGRIEVVLGQQRGLVVFEVHDNGYGISKERQGKLFERFYRAKEEATEHISGSGLGLSLVKTVVDRHGGNVWVRSELGQGSTFGFSLRLQGYAELAAAAD